MRHPDQIIGLLGEAHLKSRQQHDLQLYSSEFVPVELRRPWIHSGYRACPLSLRVCAQSLFRLNNETLNVWTHLAAIGLFTRRALVEPRFSGSQTDRALESLLLSSALLCFALSACFHLLNSVSLRVYRALHKADIGGIVCLIAACYLAGLQLGFRCAPHWARRYQGGISCGCVSFLWSFVRGDGVARGAVLAMVLLVALSIVPLTHWATAIATDDEIVAFGPRLVRFFGMLGLGLAFHSSRFPERVAPGRFDLWGHSHTWWHVCVVLAIESFHTSLVDYSHIVGGHCPRS